MDLVINFIGRFNSSMSWVPMILRKIENCLETEKIPRLASYYVRLARFCKKFSIYRIFHNRDNGLKNVKITKSSR